MNNNQNEQPVKIKTASRDLAKLVTLELVFPHGRGRSTYYTKV